MAPQRHRSNRSLWSLPLWVRLDSLQRSKLLCLKMLVRPSTDLDVAAITEIYDHHVRHGIASFETDPPDADEMARRRSEIIERGLPWLAAEMKGSVLGYAYAVQYRSRAAYRFTLEDSIYVHPMHIGKGIGKLLLQELIARCQEVGARQMIAVIGDTDNPASVRLHARFGFRHVGVLQAVGFKFQRWLDTVLMQRPL
jgi:L-amino acid N-acyltransferase YncA